MLHCDKEGLLVLLGFRGKFLLKKQNKTLPCSLSVGGWEASKQFSEHDSCVSCFNSIKMAEQNLAKLSEGEKKNHLSVQNKPGKF